MSTQNRQILPVLESDLETLAYFIFASNLQQATNRFLFVDWPNEPAQVSLFLNSMKLAFKDPDQEMFKVVDDSGETVASLILSRKRPSGEANTISPISEVLRAPDDVNLEVYAVFRAALAEVYRPTEGIERFVLETIFVKPGSRNSGLGTQLVNLCLDRAFAEGLPLFLNSVPSAVGFYRKLGFENTVHADIDLCKWSPEHGGFGTYRLRGMVVNH